MFFLAHIYFQSYFGLSYDKIVSHRCCNLCKCGFWLCNMDDISYFERLICSEVVWWLDCGSRHTFAMVGSSLESMLWNSWAVSVLALVDDAEWKFSTRVLMANSRSVCYREREQFQTQVELKSNVSRAIKESNGFTERA